MKMTLLAAGIAGALLSTAAAATPLTLSYSVTDTGDGYRYDFALTLDNHDGTWAAGQQWDWIIFGDTDADGTHNGFDPDGQGPQPLDWTTLDFGGVIASISTAGGAHNGATLILGTNGVSLPGWEPLAIGDSIAWSGTSTRLIPDGELLWSALEFGGGATRVEFELGHLVDALPDPVPEPGMLGLLGLGLAGLGVSRRTGSRRRG